LLIAHFQGIMTFQFILFVCRLIQNFIHRDLKPENLLLDAGDNILVADFGCTASVGRKRLRNSLCGTPDYLAPEMLKNEPYSDTVDVWTIGILSYEFLVGKTPFRRAAEERQRLRGQGGPSAPTPNLQQEQAAAAGVEQGLQECILAGQVDFPPHVSPQARDLITKVRIIKGQIIRGTTSVVRDNRPGAG